MEQSLGLTDFILQRIAFLEAEKLRIQGAIDELKRLQGIVKVTPAVAEEVPAEA